MNTHIPCNHYWIEGRNAGSGNNYYLCMKCHDRAIQMETCKTMFGLKTDAYLACKYVMTHTEFSKQLNKQEEE